MKWSVGRGKTTEMTYEMDCRKGIDHRDDT